MKGLLLEAEWKVRRGYKLAKREKETRRALNGSNIWKNPKLEIQEVTIPKIDSDEVLIRVRACGVCGSDVHMSEVNSDGYILFPGHCKFPCIIGHEFAGQIEEVGKKVKNLKVGDIVTAEEMNWCGECLPCRAGMVNQCESLEEIGFTIDGAFAEYVAVKAKYCCKIDTLVNTYGDREKAYEAGALVEPTSVTYNAMFTRAGGFKPGGNLVIFGAGPIGLAATALARAAGAAKVIVFETTPPRIDLAKKMGADKVYSPKDLEQQGIKPHEAVLEDTEGVGGAMLVEAAGACSQTIPEMEKAMAINGKIVQIGMVAGKTPMDLLTFQVKGSHFHGSIGHSGHDNFPSVIRLMAAGRIDMTEIITNRFPLDKAIDAITSSGSLREGKVLVKL